MKLVAVTLRREPGPHGEERDGLDPRWWQFCERVGVIPLPLPNQLPLAKALLDRVPVQGVLLTGGGDLGAYGGSEGERDAVETWLIERALAEHKPLMGVCRGMQAIQHFFGIGLQRVTGHIQPSQTIEIDGQQQVVNSFHEWGTKERLSPLRVWATHGDGVVKAVKHEKAPLVGVMWHPERLQPFRPEDVEQFRKTWGIHE